jgi:hypothetical protein
MIVTSKVSLGTMIGRAVEGMILWLTEKPARRRRVATLNLGIIGSSTAYRLWMRRADDSWPLDARAMLAQAGQNAFSISKDPGGSYDPKRDLANYEAAEQVAWASRRQRYATTGERVEAALSPEHGVPVIGPEEEPPVSSAVARRLAQRARAARRAVEPPPEPEED